MIEFDAGERNPFLDKDTLPIEELLARIDSYIQAVVDFLDADASAITLI